MIGDQTDRLLRLRRNRPDWSGRDNRRSAVVSSAIVAVTLLCLAGNGGAVAGIQGPVETEGGAEAAGWHGYVPDEWCASCHGAIAVEFQTLGMSRSFARPSRARSIETFVDRDEASFSDGQTSYKMSKTVDGLVFSKWQVAADGQPIHRWSHSVDWVMGSGATSRVYLVQSKDGTLYQLPLAWYSQEGIWAKTPGTATVDQEGGLRLVRRECMFCHTGVPTDPGFDDRRFAPQSFPHNLPEGIGCQRCHGPGAEHVETARSLLGHMPKDLVGRRKARETIRARVINPARLSPERRRDVCAQCHHQPAVALFGQRRFDRTDYQYAAGDVLADFLLKLEVLDLDEDGEPRPSAKRFEINHHAYRLEQSLCLRASPKGKLECTSCHDPHRKPARAEVLARTRSVCMGCHGSIDDAAEAGIKQHFDQADCVTCHMPRRRAQDVVHVVMTDHRIQRRAAPEKDRLAPRLETTPMVVNVVPLDSLEASATPFDDLIRYSAGLRSGALEPFDALERLVGQLEQPELAANLIEPRMRLADAHLRQGRMRLADRELNNLIRREGVGSDVKAKSRAMLAASKARQGQLALAVELLGQAIALSPTRPAYLYYNRGLLRQRLGEVAGSCRDLESAVARNEYLARAWFFVGMCRRGQDRTAAAEAFERALSLDPEYRAAAGPLVELLEGLGRAEDAQRVKRHWGGR